jgi:hypothetical protein
MAEFTRRTVITRQVSLTAFLLLVLRFTLRCHKTIHYKAAAACDVMRPEKTTILCELNP